MLKSKQHLDTGGKSFVFDFPTHIYVLLAFKTWGLVGVERATSAKFLASAQSYLAAIFFDEANVILKVRMRKRSTY